jgi:hypothetical protein
MATAIQPVALFPHADATFVLRAVAGTDTRLTPIASAVAGIRHHPLTRSAGQIAKQMAPKRFLPLSISRAKVGESIKPPRNVKTDRQDLRARADAPRRPCS